MTKIVFISDFFLNEVRGGAEKCNEVFIEKASSVFDVVKIKSSAVTDKFIRKNEDSIFIVANFFMLSEKAKAALQNSNYFIYEHDHKYVNTNNPAKFKNFEIPIENLINLEFYSGANAVFCQSTMHAEILYKNTLLKNIVNLAGNLWSDDDLAIIESKIGTEKTIDNAIMRSNNPNKGQKSTVSYCNSKKINFDFIEHQEYSKFIDNLAKVKNLYFFPQWVETYNRVAIESRILGCKLITNGLIGVTKENYFALKGRDLFDKIKSNNQKVFEKIVSTVNGENTNYYKSFDIPKVTFITSMYKGSKFIKGFLENITNLDLFEDSELLIYDSDSPENEYSICKPYLEKYKNIKYKRLDKNHCPTEVLNFGVKDSTGDYLTTAPVDDIRDRMYLRWSIKELLQTSDNTCLVYGNCLKTNKPNETMKKNSANSLYEHSINSFSKENMIKSLPGPMPVWKKSVHDAVGLFNEKYRYPADWELWLRMVDHGYEFKKINKVLGLYYFNESGLTTAKDTAIEKLTQEAEVFFKFKHIFGHNFVRYHPHFSNYYKGV